MSLLRAALLGTIVTFFAVAGALRGAVFYVDPEKGDMANDGSAERPWRTAQQVFELNLIQTRDSSGNLKNLQAPVRAGDTILLRSGYHGEIYCRGAHNDDYITIAAQEGHIPKLRRVFFAAAKKWIIRGLTVSPGFAPEYNRDRLIYVVDWGGPSADFVIERNTLYSKADASSWSAEEWDSLACYGISVIGSRIKIRNNTLRYVDYGIVISGDAITVDHNIIVKDLSRFFLNPQNYDMHHKEGSPALDAGSATLAPAIDIDGVRRPQGAGIDLGPYEKKIENEAKSE